MKKIAWCLISILCFISCNQENDVLNSDSDLNDEIVILKERETPWRPSDFNSKSVKLRGTRSYSGLSHRNFLGYSLKNDIYPLEDTRNLGNQVIDIDKLSKDYPNYVKAWKNNMGEATSFTYATFDRYLSNSTITGSVNNEGGLNLGLFSVGNKENVKGVLTKNFAEDKNATFGELNIFIRDSVYRMQYSTEIQKKIITKYLSEDFKDELYNTHPTELFKNYGGFVITGFVTGGKATAIYGGKYNKTEENKIKEINLSSEINASYGFNYKGVDNGGKISGDLKLGGAANGSTSVTKEFSSIIMSIKTTGGNPSFAAFSVPKEVKNTDVNLSSWVNSLSDKNNLNIIEFDTKGLLPISDLIVENNLREQIKTYYEKGVSTYERLKEPKIAITVRRLNQPNMVFVMTHLDTRFGNSILLKSKYMGHMSPNLKQKVDDYVNAEVDRVSKMFKVKITSNLRNLRARQSFGEKPETSLDFDGFDERDLKKYIYNGTVYVVSDYIIDSDWHPRKNKKYALSIHNNRIIDEYAMRDFINRLPVVNMNYEDFIRNYIIDAL